MKSFIAFIALIFFSHITMANSCQKADRIIINVSPGYSTIDDYGVQLKSIFSELEFDVILNNNSGILLEYFGERFFNQDVPVSLRLLATDNLCPEDLNIILNGLQNIEAIGGLTPNISTKIIPKNERIKNSGRTVIIELNQYS